MTFIKNISNKNCISERGHVMIKKIDLLRQHDYKNKNIRVQLTKNE